MDITYVGSPEDMALPFFTYGFFKPGQLAYHRIEGYVDGEPSAEKIRHEMRYRDAIVFIVSEESEEYQTSGYLIEFSNPQEAYEEIGNSIPEDLYKWKEIKVKDGYANALVGCKEKCGFIDNYDHNPSPYDYRRDPFFNDALSLIKDTMKEFEDKDITNLRDFFKLQMHYMLLWSVIERFCTLSYGYFSIGPNKDKFAKEKSFKNKLKTIERDDEIYSSDKIKKKFINPRKWQSIFYYYTIRCNVVHKGKNVGVEDMNKLKYSLEELYQLFMAVYIDKLMENDKTIEKYQKRF